MNTVIRTLLFIFMSFAAGLSDGQAQTSVTFSDSAHAWTVDELPMPHLEDSLRYTVNPDRALSSAYVDSLDVVSRHLRNQFGVEMVCVAVGRVAGGDVYAWGDSLFTKYGFGKRGTDNGLLIVVSALDREWRIFPGKGLEGVLPDAVCNRIGNRAMVPFLKEGKYDEALWNAACSVYGILAEDPDYAEYTNFDDESDDGLGGALGVIGGIGLGLGAIAYFGRKKCPRCKAYMKVQNRVLVSRVGTVKTYNVTYVCPKCGHSFTTTEKVDLAASAAAAGSAIGSNRWGGGGGGFRGGHFGGGSFGGGGAGGRF